MFHDAPMTPAGVVQRRERKQTRCVRRHYKLDDVMAFINRGPLGNGTAPFRRVALQFPDELLDDAVLVTQTLKEMLATDTIAHTGQENKEKNEDEIRFFVLADNTFGSCCPDEITAQHYQSDCIVHFGEACMSRSTRVPVFYVEDDFAFHAFFNQAEHVELSARAVLRAVALLRERISHHCCGKESIGCVRLTVVGSHRSRTIVTAAEERWRELDRTQNEETSSSAQVKPRVGVVVEWPSFVSFATSSGSRDMLETDPHVEIPSSQPMWVANGVRFSRTGSDVVSVQYFIYIGSSNASLPLHILNVHHYNLFHLSEDIRESVFDTNDGPPVLTILNETFGVGMKETDIEHMNPTTQTALDVMITAQFEESSSHLLASNILLLNRRMRQRGYNVEFIRSSTAIGILVASLAIEGYYETTMLLHQLLRAHGKRSYIIYIGHLNQYKLANFVDTVDCFVAITCPNSREGHFPGKDDCFPKPVVSPVEVLLALCARDEDSSLFGHPAVYSTAFECVLPPLRAAMEAVKKERESSKLTTIEMQQDGGSGAALIRTSNGALLAQQGAVGALARLRERTFLGLDPRLGQTPVQGEILQGKHGIARGYAAEKERQDA